MANTEPPAALETWRSTRALTLLLVAAALALALPSVLAAHPPYEIPERVLTGEDGRTYRLMRSYVDGIFFSDPVKLVVRDEEDRALAQTEYGRYVAVICPDSPRCLVFLYDGLGPVLPDEVWRLQDGRLTDARTVKTVLLGSVVPLWSHTGAYLFSILTLAAPLLVLWLALRNAWPLWLTVCLVVALLPYLALWLYFVVLLSAVSLPVVVLVCAAVVGALFGVTHLATRIGVREETLGWFGVLSARVAAVLLVLFVLALVGFGIWSSSLRPDDIEFEERAAGPPLAGARLTIVDGATDEVFLRAAPGFSMAQLVDLELFDGFDARMSREQAESRLGDASGTWTDPAYRVRALYYDRPGGRVSLVRRGAGYWTTVAHPSTCDPSEVLPDPRLREQLKQWLPEQGTVQVNLRTEGRGSVSIQLGRSGCTLLTLNARERAGDES